MSATFVQLSPLVRRVTAPNAGPMTVNGTNSYLIGNKEIAVIDPGPDIASHIENILAAAPGVIKWIYVTHTHPDHSPGAKQLVEATGAQLRGCVLDPDDGHQDLSFKPPHNIQHNELHKSDEFTLQALHTPGHVGNHFCYWLHEESLLFAGDHMIDGTTVVIMPPSGDMKAYIESLNQLKQLPIKTVAPGHGELINNAQQEFQRIVDHRLQREAKVVAGLTVTGESSLENLVKEVYKDVDTSLHRVAQYSLWAHLLKLEKDKVVEKTIDKHWAFGKERWRLIPSDQPN